MRPLAVAREFFANGIPKRPVLCVALIVLNFRFAWISSLPQDCIAFFGSALQAQSRHKLCSGEERNGRQMLGKMREVIALLRRYLLPITAAFMQKRDILLAKPVAGRDSCT